MRCDVLLLVKSKHVFREVVHVISKESELYRRREICLTMQCGLIYRPKQLQLCPSLFFLFLQLAVAHWRERYHTRASLFHKHKANYDVAAGRLAETRKAKSEVRYTRHVGHTSRECLTASTWHACPLSFRVILNFCFRHHFFFSLLNLVLSTRYSHSFFATFALKTLATLLSTRREIIAYIRALTYAHR
jgi:hypothetical protein